jgi:hypothetical protein
MVSHLFFYQLTLIALVWLCVMLHWVWPSDSAAACPTTLAPPPFCSRFLKNDGTTAYKR